jgi:hypothetical protein
MTNFSFDYETFGIAPMIQAPPPVCLSFAYDDAPAELVHAKDPAMWRILREAFESGATLTAFNAVYELAVTLSAQPDWVTMVFDALRAGRVYCPLSAEKLIRIARGDQRNAGNLNDLLQHYGCGITLDKESHWRSRYGTLYDVPLERWPAEAVAYAIGDVEVRRVRKAQLKLDPRYLVDLPYQIRADLALYLTTCWGFPTDPQQAAKLLEETEATLERLGREVPRGAVTEKMAEKGLELGNISLNEEACFGAQDPLLEAYSTYSQARTLRSKVRRLRMPIIQCRYDVLGADSARTTSSQGDDPDPGQPWLAYGMQMQNLARSGEEVVDPITGKKSVKWGQRECFVSRGMREFILQYPDSWQQRIRDGQLPRTSILSVDFDAFEMRTWAQVCFWIFGYSDLREILNNPERCPHVEMGTRLRDQYVEAADWRQAYAWGYDLKARTDKASRDETKAVRGVAKGPNFGLPGGMKEWRLIDYCRKNYGVTITIEQAIRAREVWGEIYREAFPYLEWVKGQVGREFGSRNTIEQFVSKRLRGDVGYTDASNGYFQSLAADAAKRAGWALIEEAYERKGSPFYGARPLAFVHDEWLFEVQTDRVHEAGYRMAQVQVAAAQAIVPDVLISASPAAMFRWSKAHGDPMHNKQGVLIPYEVAEAT